MEIRIKKYHKPIWTEKQTSANWGPNSRFILEANFKPLKPKLNQSKLALALIFLNYLTYLCKLCTKITQKIKIKAKMHPNNKAIFWESNKKWKNTNNPRFQRDFGFFYVTAYSWVLCNTFFYLQAIKWRASPVTNCTYLESCICEIKAIQCHKKNLSDDPT